MCEGGLQGEFQKTMTNLKMNTWIAALEDVLKTTFLVPKITHFLSSEKLKPTWTLSHTNSGTLNTHISRAIAKGTMAVTYR